MEVEVYAVLFRVLMFVIGACAGSFLCCQARRLRRAELAEEKLGKRSVCLGCGEQLKWYDNLPVVSWVMLKGKCRKCKQKIGAAEIVAEVAMGVAFLLVSLTVEVGTATGLEWAEFIGVLVFSLVLGFLAIYDGLYGELPSLYLTILVLCAIMVVILKQWSLFSGAGFSWGEVLVPIASGVVLAAPYGVLCLMSRGKWVGDGDWILGLAIGLVLGEPFLALFALFFANMVACVVMYPMTKKKKSRKIYMGPFLGVGFVLTYVLAEGLMGLMAGV